VRGAAGGARDRSALIAFHRPGARGGAEVRRAARSPIVFDDFIALAFKRGIDATGGRCLSVRRKNVRRTREVVAGET